MSAPALLVLEDGTVFYGQAIGAQGQTVGEVVFNTAMTGYQEILTDPSYCRQIVTLTYPHIGNTGCNSDDLESRKVFAAGLVIRDRADDRQQLPLEQSLPDEFLRRGNVVAIADIDTRRLTRLLREKGALAGCIMTGEDMAETALRDARKFPGIAGMDLAKFVTTDGAYQWAQGSIWPDRDPVVTRRIAPNHVVAYDFGIKRNILRRLAEHDCRITVVPATTPVDEVLALSPTACSCPTARATRSPATTPSRRPAELLERACRVRHLPGTPDPRLAAGARTTDCPGLQFPGPSGGESRAARHRPLFDHFVELIATPAPLSRVAYFQNKVDSTVQPRLPVRSRTCQTKRHPEHPDHRRRADRDRPGLRVRLLRRPGLQGAARGGLPGHPGELQPGHDHDRPGDGRCHLHRADHLGAVAKAIIEQEQPGRRCCRPWAARRR